MKKSMNRFVCGLTAAVMMGTLTACSSGQGETKPAAPAGSESAGIQRVLPSRERPRQR